MSEALEPKDGASTDIDPDAAGELAAALEALARDSFVAHHAAQIALPPVLVYGDAVALEWLAACRRLFEFDRDAGRAFARATPDVAAVAKSVLPWTRQALRFLDYPGSWKAIDGFMGNLVNAYTTLGPVGEMRWADIGFAWCGRHTDSGNAYFNTPVHDLAGRLGVPGIEQLSAPAEALFTTRRLALGTFLPGALRVRALLGHGAIAPWARRGIDVLTADRFRGEAYFRLESDESLRLLLDDLPGFRAQQNERFLKMLLTAWYGEACDIQDSGWSPDKGRAFVETDGRAVLAPVTLPDREHAVLGVLHVAGHLQFGTYAVAPLKVLFAQLGLDAEITDARAISWEPLIAQFGDDTGRFKLLFDLCEDLRVDHAIAMIAPTHLRRLARLAALLPMPDGVARDYYRLASASLQFALGGAHSLSQEVATGFARLLEPDATVVDAFRVARSLLPGLDLPKPQTPEDVQNAYLPGRSPNLGRDVKAAQGPGSQSERSEQKESQSGEAEGEQDEDSETVEQETGPQDAEADDSGGAAAHAQSAANRKGTGQTRTGERPAQPQTKTGGPDRWLPYPEWDYRENRYKIDWAWVAEKVLAESNPQEAQRLADRHAGTLKRLKKAIQSQKPTRPAPLTRQMDGDDLDLEATVRYVTERIAGRSPEARVYKRRAIRNRDVAVTLLADLSTSIMQTVADGNGRLVDTVRAGVLLFAESMEEVGDPYSIAGFCSKYRDNVNYYRIKDFDQPFDDRVRATVGGLSGRLATRMGAAIRHAVHRFEGVSTPRRLLLLLSDGRPEDYDDGGDRRYLHEDTRMAVKEAVNAGVHPFCITVDTLANQYLPQIFGRGHYLVLDQIGSLPAKLPEIYLRLRR
ncbi:MAG: VWA domain-containing protein [Proteobacteria bacterium]|nr:VWA domain-containing protein [Burkholderiales bacterium]